VDAPAIDKMSAIVELLSPCLRSALPALTGVPTKSDGSGSLRSLVLANRCFAPGHKTVPRLVILAVPPRDRCTPRPNRSCQKDSAGCPDLFGDPKGHRERTARLGRAVALLAGSGRSTRRLPRHRACGLRASHRGAIRDWSRAAGSRVAELQSRSSIPEWSPEAPLLPDLFYEFGNAPPAFQMGVPAQDCEQEFRLRRPLGVMSAVGHKADVPDARSDVCF
jgi:hypothetical protein